MQKRKDSRASQHPPFLITTKRFATLGLHPSLDKSGSQKKKITDAGPGSYNPKLPTCSFKNGYLWQLKVESENFSKYRGHKSPELVERAKFQNSLRGPGAYDINEHIYWRQQDSVSENVNLGRQKRFVDESPNNPPPGTYFRNINERAILTNKTKTPTFEFDGFIDRFQSSVPSYLLPPNIYDHMKHDGKNTSDISKKVVSTKGPYTLFTGPRNATTIKNHFAPPIFKPPEYFYIKPSDLDNLLQHPKKSRIGKFLKNKRFTKKPTVRHMLNDLSLCYRSPHDPGPAHYNIENIESITKKPPTLYAFDTSNPIARPPPARWTILPGPGRYSPKVPRCMKPKRQSWIFLSKIKRQIYEVINYSAF